MLRNILINADRNALKLSFKAGTRLKKCISISPVQNTSWNYVYGINERDCKQPILSQSNFSTRLHSSTTAVTEVAPKLRSLDTRTVKSIIEELRNVDNNSDERIDTEELKQLLRKHNNTFSDEEIFEIGELFYAGKSGGSVSFRRFVQAIDTVVQHESAKDGQPVEKNPLDLGSCASEYMFYKDHGYTPEELKVKQTHIEPDSIKDRLAYNAVKAVRLGFDAATGWNYGKITPEMILTRTIYLETIAAVPGMVAAIIRHFSSLRNFKRDNGMMQMFLDEANNERMHLLTFVRMKDPGYVMRAAVIVGQIGFGSVFLLAYAISPQFCHRFVGYVEEEAVSTYTKIIQAVEDAPEGTELARWRTDYAPRIARSYWKLGEQGTVLDMIYAIRADEAEHRDVNHYCSKYEEGMPNPVFNPEEKLNSMLLKFARDIMDRKKDDKNYKPEVPNMQ